MKESNKYFKRTKQKIIGSAELAEQISKGTYYKKFSHFMHKFDGTHAELIISDKVKFITREGIDVTHLVPHLVSTINNWCDKSAYNGAYACELVHLSAVEHDPKTAWGLSRNVLARKEADSDNPFIDCIIYDIHNSSTIKGNTSYFDRVQSLPIEAEQKGEYSALAHKIKGLDNFYKPNMIKIDKLLEAWDKYIINDEKEGFVLLDLYKKIEWDLTFTKFKPLLDIDCIVIGFNMGTVGKKHDGMIASLQVGVLRDGKMHDLGKIPHMSDHDREIWTKRMNSDNMIQYVIQVECAEITTAGKLRFPNYVRERTDKKISECTWDSIG